MAPSKQRLMGAQSMIDSVIQKNCSGPILIRLAWHDSGTYDSTSTDPWPAPGGATASIRLDPEIKHRANVDLSIAMNQLQPVKDAYPDVSYADIYQMASARAIALAGGPIIDMKYGRVDATPADQSTPEGNLPIPVQMPSGKYGMGKTESSTMGEHLRKVFYRMGLNDEDIVSLSGAHTLGRAYKHRSGVVNVEQTKFTNGSTQKLVDGSDAKYKPGGSSWTPNFLVFDNSYYQITEAAQKGLLDRDLFSLPSDMVIFADEGFRPFAIKFRDSQAAFFDSYAKSHKKLSEVGSKFDPKEGISLFEPKNGVSI